MEQNNKNQEELTDAQKLENALKERDALAAKLAATKEHSIMKEVGETALSGLAYGAGLTAGIVIISCIAKGIASAFSDGAPAETTEA